MGIVYRAKDRRLKRTVAIKVLPPELAFRSEIRPRFLREAETAAQLSHPNIVPIYSVDEQDGLVFFVMAFVDGDNAREAPARSRRALDPTETRRILREVARRARLRPRARRGAPRHQARQHPARRRRAAARWSPTSASRARSATARLAAHGDRHRDRHAGVHEPGAGGGRPRRSTAAATSTRSASSATRCSRGELPFNATSTPALLVKHISERPVPVEQRRSDVPPDLARAVMLLLEKDPDNRFPNAQALSSRRSTPGACRRSRSSARHGCRGRRRRRRSAPARRRTAVSGGRTAVRVRAASARPPRSGAAGRRRRSSKFRQEGRAVPVRRTACSWCSIVTAGADLLWRPGDLDRLHGVPVSRALERRATTGATCSASRATAT